MAQQHNDPAFDAAVDELYGAPPDEFVLTRARLERELRDAGDREAATALRRLRRPGLAVWAVNQLARHDPDAIDELLQATERVRAAQHTLLQGGSADALRDEARSRQELIDALVDEGTRLLVGHAPRPQTYRDDIASLLEAASLDADTVDTLRAGRLTRLLPPPVGFDALVEAPAVTPAPQPALEPAEPSRKARREFDAARRDADDARRKADAARKAAEEADAEATSAGIAADTARSRVADVERALDQAREEQRAAARRAEDARERAAAARRTAEQTLERLRRAEERLRQLGR